MGGRFQAKAVLITGATSGIGRATAIAFGREGAQVALAGWNAEAGAVAAEEVRAAGGQAVFVKADVGHIADAERMVAETIRAFGRLDVAFNNAGVMQGGEALTAEQDEERFDQVMNVDVRGPLALDEI